MTQFLSPDSYTDLCPKCRSTLARITGLFQDGLMPDTDDPEAPCMYLYDHGLYCGKYECLGAEDARPADQPGDEVLVRILRGEV